MSTDLLKKIRDLGKYFDSRRPTAVKIGSNQGRIIYAPTPDELYGQLETQERLATARKLMRMRVDAFVQLQMAIPELSDLDRILESSEHLYGLIGEIRKELDSKLETYGIWRTRLTTSTHMVRTDDIDRNDTVFFYEGDPFSSPDIANAVRGRLSDGGFKYSEEALRRIRTETPKESRLSYVEYLQARGGNFTGENWLNHPIFRRALGNGELMEEYVFALQVLDLFGFYNQGLHSGWRPGEMKKNFGRPVSLGFQGEAFYPPNNSTLGHAALVLEVAR